MEAGEPQKTGATEENRYRLLVEAITDYAVYMLDADGIVVSWNSGAERFKGYSADEVIGEHFSRFYTNEDRAAGLPEKALATAASEGRFENEGWRVRKDGTRFWTHVVIDPIRAPSGDLIGYAKITRDLTERKAAEAALKRSEDQFRLLVQGVTDYAIFMLDPDGLVASWNAGAQRIKGYTADEIVGRHFSCFYPEDDREAGAPQRNLAIATSKGRFEKEGWRVRKDGTRFWANVVIDAIRSESGELLGFAKITRDITEREEAQRELEKAREALFQAQKLEALGQLTGGVAHDFNNLLMVITSSLELIRKRLPDDPRLSDLVANATRAALRGSSLTQRMLSFARRQDLVRTPVDLPQLVRGLGDMLQRSLGPTIGVETRFPIALPRAFVDANQLEAAILNLSVNARDAMPEGGPLVISAHVEDVVAGHSTDLAPGRYICLSVRDEGQGMDEETLARATDPFFTTKGIGKGTGLGLSMVHGFAEQSGGRLTIESEPGVGTAVGLWLPVAMDAVETGPSDVELPPDRQAKDGPELTVLAVDDDPLVLMSTGAMLEDLGYTVVEASSGNEALDKLKQNEGIGLVVTDQAMPRMTGAQLIEAIRADRPNLPIILATGYAEMPEEIVPDVSRLSKPFSQEQLRRAVADAVGGRSLSSRIQDIFRS